eukprot:1161964-Pelagomonas_calceolata.AAC.9
MCSASGALRVPPPLYRLGLFHATLAYACETGCAQPQILSEFPNPCIGWGSSMPPLHMHLKPGVLSLRCSLSSFTPAPLYRLGPFCAPLGYACEAGRAQPQVSPCNPGLAHTYKEYIFLSCSSFTVLVLLRPTCFSSRVKNGWPGTKFSLATAE